MERTALQPRPNDALEAGYLTLVEDQAVARLAARRAAGEPWRDVGDGPRACLVHDRLHTGECPACGAEAIEAAGQLFGRYREHGGSLLVALEAAITLHRQGRAPSAEQLERWAELVRTVRGF